MPIAACDDYSGINYTMSRLESNLIPAVWPLIFRTQWGEYPPVRTFTKVVDPISFAIPSSIPENTIISLQGMENAGYAPGFLSVISVTPKPQVKMMITLYRNIAHNSWNCCRDEQTRHYANSTILRSGTTLRAIKAGDRSNIARRVREFSHSPGRDFFRCSKANASKCTKNYCSGLAQHTKIYGVAKTFKKPPLTQEDAQTGYRTSRDGLMWAISM